MNAVTKEGWSTKDLDRLKDRSNSARMSGDYERFSHHLEPEGQRFSRRFGARSEIQLPDSLRSTEPDLFVRGWHSSFRGMARSLAESRTETAEYPEELQHKELTEEELRRLVARARLNVLISQINPHFLFNALTTIEALIEENPDTARHLTIKMASIFRQVLRATEREMVSLHEELSFIQDYLEIEKARFGDRLRVEQTISVKNAEIPCFTLQLLVENAIKHGASPKVGTTTVRILVLQDGDRIQIEVSDDGVGMTKDALVHILEKGYGLRNLIDRLSILYASHFSWHVESEFQKGTIVSLQLPLSPSARTMK